VRILIDECVPRQIRSRLPGHYVRTAREAGFGGYKNGRLIKAAEKDFDLMITSDKNLRYQQNLSGRTLSILLLSTNDRTAIEIDGGKILQAVNQMLPATFEEIVL
jgi:predicted nuclease of predicted toxin-antitoxin system